MEDFIACFAEVTDPRQDNARHTLHEVLLIALCTTLCDGEDCSDMPLFGQAKEPFLRQFLTLKHGIPSHDTFSRVFRLLDPVAFAGCFTRFMQRFTDSLQGVVAIDGKTLRRSFDRAARQSVISLAPGTKVFLACRPIDLRNGFDGLAAKAQQIIGESPFSGHLFLFRGKRGEQDAYALAVPARLHAL